MSHVELSLQVQLDGDILPPIAGLPPRHLLLSPGHGGRVPPVDDVLDGVGETLLTGVAVVALLANTFPATSVRLGVDGGDDAILLLQTSGQSGESSKTTHTHRLLQAAGITGVHLVPPPDEEVSRGGVTRPPVTALQELRLELRGDISYRTTFKPSPEISDSPPPDVSRYKYNIL